MDRKANYLLYITVVFIGSLSCQGSTPSTVVIKRGSDLELKCYNYSKGCMWRFNGLLLHNYTSDCDNVLKIYNVTYKDQGVYWCGLSWQQGYNISVLIGDIPSRPRNLKTTSFDFAKTLHWTASKSPGNLPVHYTVYIKCLTQSSIDGLECQKSHSKFHKVSDCQIYKHNPGKQYSCSLNSVDMMSKYIACVVAVNQLGNSSACIHFIRAEIIDVSKTIPTPLKDLNAIEVRAGNVRLSWKDYEVLRAHYPVEALLTFSYSKSGDKMNKTLLSHVRSTDRSVVISSLRGGRRYTFYAVARFVIGDLSSSFSAPAFATVQTNYSAPDEPPQNIRCNASEPDSNRKRNISLFWEPPRVQDLNGPLSGYLIAISITDGKLFNQTKKKESPTTSISIPGFDAKDDVSFIVRACTRGHYCSSVSNSCLVLGIRENSPGVLSSPSTLKLAIGVGVGVLFIIAVVLSLRSYWQRKKARRLDEEPDSLPSIEVNDYDNPAPAVTEVQYASAFSPPSTIDTPLISSV